MTRKSIIALFLVAAALLGETQSSNARSPDYTGHESASHWLSILPWLG
jgi:hypothetical protein